MPLPEPGATLQLVVDSPKMHYLFLGNPGVGKSTILNGLLGECLFRSGFSPGTGMTDKLQKEEKNGEVYMDTPGLADVELPKQAAEAITTALKQDGRYRIFFVLTLHAGRCRPGDKAIMEMVLKSAPIGDNYGVIFNKVPKYALRLVQDDQSVKDYFLAALFANTPATRFVNYCAKDNDLEDENNVVRPLSQELEQFIKNMPPVEIKPEAVTEIKGNDFEEIQLKHEMILRQMQRNSEVLRAQVTLQVQQMQAQAERMEQQSRESAEVRQQLMIVSQSQGGGSTQLIPIPCSVM